MKQSYSVWEWVWAVFGLAAIVWLGLFMIGYISGRYF